MRVGEKSNSDRSVEVVSLDTMLSDNSVEQGTQPHTAPSNRLRKTQLHDFPGSPMMADI